MPVLGQEVHRPNGIVGEILFDIGEARHRLSFGEIFAGRKLRVSEDRDAVAERSRDLSLFVAGRDRDRQSRMARKLDLHEDAVVQCGRSTVAIMGFEYAERDRPISVFADRCFRVDEPPPTAGH